jgi:cysteine-rich repeat protein
MKASVWIAAGLVSLMCAACEMGDVNVNDFLNDMTVGDQEDNDVDTGDIDTGVDGMCGDGIIQWDLGESCDDGNAWWGDGCNEYCWVESGWSCPWPGQSCYWVGYPGYCGDGIVQWDIGEQCDDGNTWDGDGCSSWCAYEYPNNCYYEGQYYMAGETWWIDNYTYCYCADWNEISCYENGMAIII